MGRGEMRLPLLAVALLAAPGLRAGQAARFLPGPSRSQYAALHLRPRPRRHRGRARRLDARSAAGSRTDTSVFGDTLVRYGLTSNLEMQLGWTAFGTVRQRDASGVSRMSGTGDVSVALRRNLLHPDGSGVSVALMPYASLPTGGDAIGAGTWSAGMLVPASFDLGHNYQLGLTGRVEAAANASRLRPPPRLRRRHGRRPSGRAAAHRGRRSSRCSGTSIRRAMRLQWSPPSPSPISPTRRCSSTSAPTRAFRAGRRRGSSPPASRSASERPSERLGGGPSARPRPLEIVAAEPAGDVDGLADREKARHAPGFHGLARKPAGGDAAHRHFGLGEASVPFGRNARRRAALRLLEPAVGEVCELPAGRAVPPAPRPAAPAGGARAAPSRRGAAAPAWPAAAMPGARREGSRWRAARHGASRRRSAGSPGRTGRDG